MRFRDRDHARLGDIAAEGAPHLQEIALFVVPEDFVFDVTQPWSCSSSCSAPSARATRRRSPSISATAAGPRRRALLPAPPPTRPAAAPQSRARRADAEARTRRTSRSGSAIWQMNRSAIGITVAALGGADGDLLLPGHAGAPPALLRRGALRLSRLHAGLARLVRQRPALGRQRPDLHQCAGHRLLLGVLPLRAADLHPLGRGRRRPAVLGPRPVLRLALPVRRAAGAAQQSGAVAEDPPGQDPLGLHERLWPIKYIIFLGLFGLSLYSLAPGRGARRGRAVQDRDHPEVHPRMAFRRCSRCSGCSPRGCSSSASSAATSARSARRSRSPAGSACSNG